MSGIAAKVVALESCLSRAGIPHAFGGALALAYCTATPRGTADIDLNVFVHPDAVDSVLEALPGGIRFDDDDRTRIARDGQVRLWWDATPVDLFFACHEFHWEVATRIQSVPFEDTEIPVISCSDLAVFKAMFARTRDWADIEAEVAFDTIAEDLVRGWIRELAGPGSSNERKFDAALKAGRSSPEPNGFSAGVFIPNSRGQAPHRERKN